VEFGEPGLDLLPEEAISTSTKTLLASLGLADPGDGGPWGWRTLWMADPGDGGPLPSIEYITQ